MKKFYHRKDLPVEESPLTLQLQRRHTVVEGDKDNTKVVTKLKPVCRSNSTSSIYRPPKTAKDLSSQKGYLESTLSSNSSGASSASTVVITECQLSSSWLYNNKKAQMCPKSPNESISASESSSRQASDNEEAKSPIIHRPKVKSISSQSSRSRKCSSCCCYAAIVILAGFAAMGIISTIGGIIYMEFFSGSNKTQSQGDSAIGRSGNLRYREEIGQVNVGGNHTSQDLSGDEIRDSSSEPKQELEILNHFKDSNNENLRKNKSKGSGNILRVRKVKKNAIPTTDADITTISPMTHEGQLQEESNEKQNVHQVNFLSPGTQNNSPYSKLFELYKDIHTNINKNSNTQQESSSFEENEPNSKVTDIEDISEHVHENEKESDNHSRLLDESFDTNESSESLHPDSEVDSEESLTLYGVKSDPEIPKYFFRRPFQDSGETFRNFFSLTGESDVSSEEQLSNQSFLPHIPKLTELTDSDDNVNIKLDVNSPDVSISSKDPLKESFKSDLDFNLNASSEPRGEVSGPAIPKNFIQIPPKNTDLTFKNIFDPDERSDVDNPEESPLPRFLPHIPELSDQNDASDSIAINLDADNQESDLPFELNRPVSEAKIALPGPLDLIRRFTMGIEPDNKGNSEVEKHDRRFFLEQALERLRSLDVRNILPSSRQKNNSKKNPEQKFEPKIQSEQEVFTERSNYLQKLRHRLYEQ
nr:uncharacterized protein LOC107451446 isoform X2 [Parasteatoda tepidariorum]